MKSIFAASVLLVVLSTVTNGQLYSHQSYNTLGGGSQFGLPVTPGIGYVPNVDDPRHLAHRAVVENAQQEAQLPEQLINPFYKNPHIANALAKESWFGDKEFPVFNRQAEKIPRAEIAKIIRRLEHRRRR